MNSRVALTRQQAEYAREFISRIAGDRSRAVDDALLETVFIGLSRREELDAFPDMEGRYSWPAAGLGDVIQRPFVDLSIIEQTREGSRHSKWPGSSEFAVCLSHDMDHVTSFSITEKIRRTFRRIRAGRAAIRSSARDIYSSARTGAASVIKKAFGKPDAIVDVSKWLAIEDAAGFNSSLYFFAEEIDPWHPFDCDYIFSDRVTFERSQCTVGEMIRRIADLGWEIGLHGSITSATEEDAFTAQKRQIEQLTSRAVETTRQHFLQYSALHTPAIHEAAGIVCDTSIGFNDGLGFRSGTCHPYHCWNWKADRPSSVFEISTQIQDGALFRQHPTIDSALEACLRVVAEVRAVGGCLGVLFHPHHLSTQRGFIVYRELLAELKRLRAWGGSCSRVISYWRGMQSHC